MEGRRRFITAVALVVMAAGRPVSAQERSPLTVTIHDSAEVGDAVLGAAQARAAAVFARAGVAVDWEGTGPGFRVQVLLRARHPQAVPGKARVMGVALAADDRRAVVSLYFEAVIEVARRYGAPIGAVLGIALAHEMGHVLLPPPSHSRDGIMKAAWEGDDIRHAVHGDLAFSDGQAELMRARLRRQLGPVVLEGHGAVEDRRVRP